MRIAIVPASKLSTKDLRASAYVTNPRRVARAVVRSWCELYPVMTLRTEGAKRLIELIEVALRTELDRNKPEKTKKLSAQEKQAMLDALGQPSAARDELVVLGKEHYRETVEDTRPRALNTFLMPDEPKTERINDCGIVHEVTPVVALSERQRHALAMADAETESVENLEAAQDIFRANERAAALEIGEHLDKEFVKHMEEAAKEPAPGEHDVVVYGRPTADAERYIFRLLGEVWPNCVVITQCLAPFPDDPLEAPREFFIFHDPGALQTTPGPRIVVAESARFVHVLISWTGVTLVVATVDLELANEIATALRVNNLVRA